MASPEEINEWLSEEMHTERPSGTTPTLEAQLSELMADTRSFERTMGNSEIIMHVLHEMDMFVLVRVLLVTCSREPEEQEVRRALAELIKWNPSLQMGIKKLQEKDGPWDLIKNPKAAPRLAVVKEPRDWREYAEDEMLKPIGDLEAPQFRCSYLTKVRHPGGGSVLQGQVGFVFALNHALIDGIGCVALLRKFLSVLNAVMRSKPYILIPWTKMFPPIDDYNKKAYDNLVNEEGGAEIKAAVDNTPHITLEQFMAMENLYTELCGTEAERHPDIKHRTCFLTREFSPEQVDRLRSECRRHGATVQGTAQILGIIALSALMPPGHKKTEDSAGEGETPETLGMHFATNLRNHTATDVPVDYAALCTGLFMTEFPRITLDPENRVADFWKHAADSTAKVKECLRTKAYLAMWKSTSSGVREAKEFNLETLRKVSKRDSRAGELYATTYGAWEFPTEADDPLKLDRLYSVSSLHNWGPVVSQQLITVNGKLFWTIAYSQRVISRETAQKYADFMFELLDKALEEPQETTGASAK